jgi:hypothetical protein
MGLLTRGYRWEGWAVLVVLDEVLEDNRHDDCQTCRSGWNASMTEQWVNDWG